MTDKQIMIDEQMENLNNLATQQLKRIEEEKRQIEHIAKTHLVETFDMQREIDKLKKELQAKEQECEELAYENYELNELFDRLKAENDELKETFDGLFKVQYKLADNNKKLRQCLTEIKEIAKKRNYLDYNECLDDILQKISEVEDGV